MGSYPKLIFPTSVIEVLEKKKFDEPSKPTSPIYPVEESFFLHKAIFLIVSVIVFFLFPKIGFFAVALSFLWIVVNPEKKNYKAQLNKFKEDEYEYKKKINEYNFFLKNGKAEYDNFMRSKLILNELISSEYSRVENEYQNGYTHDFFRNYLLSYFESINIFENITITNKFYQDFSPYVPDFAYINSKTHLKIAIEIDEPYVLSTKKPIHYNDDKRNKFFIEKKWVVVRFSESQIVMYPDLCCEYLKFLISGINYGNLNFVELNSILIRENSWSDDDSLKLADLNFRNSYLEKINKPISAEMQKEMVKSLRKMFGFELKPPVPIK